MPVRAAPSGKLPLAPVVAGAVAIAALVALLFYLNRPATRPVDEPASALKLAADCKPECAVVDLRLPTEKLGLGLIRELKALDSRMRVFVLTGADPAHLTHCPEKALIEEIVVKGASSASLIRKLKATADGS
jgi:DNA-binding NarL/FixJ family response regulator